MSNRISIRFKWATLIVVVMLCMTALASCGPFPGTAPKDRDVRINPVDQSEYVYVSGGEYTIGASQNDMDTIKKVPNGFWIKRTEVSNAEYKRCVDAGARGCSEPNNPQWSDAEPDHPVTHVTWDQAKQYAEWAGGSLPEKEEWEVACRGPEARIYPWGNQLPDHRTANLKSSHLGHPEAVDSYPDGASYYGVLNMVGNVQEWTNSPGRDGLPFRIVRGGSFHDNDVQMNCISYGWLSPELDQRRKENGEIDVEANEWDQKTTGFRVVISDPWPAGILK